MYRNPNYQLSRYLDQLIPKLLEIHSMPPKITTQHEPISINKLTIEKEKKIKGPKKFKKNLKKLMKLANMDYDKVYRKYKNVPDIEKFNSCMQNFKKIKSIIESKENPTNVTNKLYLEAWISALYSEVHALNLNPETEGQLNTLIEKIKNIGSDFTQLLTKKSILNSIDESSGELLNYINDFKRTWETKEERLLADAIITLLKA